MELASYLADVFFHLVDIFFRLDVHLAAWASMLGPWLYVVLFLIIFCETGLVVTPFLPGDSLLFAVGALASIEGSSLRLPLVAVLLFAAAVAGDAVNYAIGAHVGPRVFSNGNPRVFKQEHLVRTQRFYERYGGKTIVLARFVPIIRTFAPFVAGIANMTYPRFAVYNLVGGAAWTLAFVLGGYVFGNVPVVKRNFHFVIVTIIIISCIPPVLELLRARRERGAASIEKGMG